MRRSGDMYPGYQPETSATASIQVGVVEVSSSEASFFFPGTDRYLTSIMNKARNDSNRRYSKPFVSNMFT